MARLAAYTRQPAAGGLDSEEEAEGEFLEEQKEAEAPAAAADMAAAELESMQLSPRKAAAAAAAGPGSVVESPDSAVRRIATQRHADMMHRTAAAGICFCCDW
jgi:hypothetical protein